MTKAIQAPNRKRGRPPGSKNAKTILKEAAIDKCLKKAESIAIANAASVVQAMVDKAIKGDTAAAKLILDRVIPARRSVDEASAKDVNIQINVTEREARHGDYQAQSEESNESAGQSDGEFSSGQTGPHVISIVRSQEGQRTD